MTNSSDINTPPQGRVLIIAGSDSSGGAGIQADSWRRAARTECLCGTHEGWSLRR